MKQRHPGIYIHIPFCHSKCGYCDFYSVTDLSLAGSLISAINGEIRMASRELDPPQSFDTVYFGGGTPSILSEQQIESVMDTLKSCFTFNMNTDITLEANPGTLSTDKLRNIKHLGINRLSIGIQSFIDKELSLLERIHSADAAREAFYSAREADFNDISIDLIFALPGQTLKDWLYSLEETIKMSPEHISVYNLTYEKGTPFYKLLQSGKMKAKKEKDELLFYRTAIDKLRQNGYMQYEISNFARNKDLASRHNIKYWDHTNYLGFGPAAHSYWQDRRWANLPSIHYYIENLRNGMYPQRTAEKIDAKTREFEKIFLSLRTIEGLSLSEFQELFAHSFVETYKTEIEKLLTAGLARINGDNICLTPEGFYICDEIISNFART
ncbi:MAG: radical SAM family heme chaperone HemW [Calditrichaceae bacterium]